MAISESIKRAAQDVETALAVADTGVRALRQAEGDHHPGNGLVDFHQNVIFDLAEVVGELIQAINRESRA